MPRNTYGRIDGRRGVKLRKRRLDGEPLCRICKAKGITRIATTPDHIKPLALGGTDTDDNCQSLCQECHAIKTASEGNAFAASNYPEWLAPSAIPLTIVCGPPASGKTTYVNTQASAYDRIICLDTIFTQIRPSYRHWAGRLDKQIMNTGVRIRNAQLGQLARQSDNAAWFIVSAPSQAERAWWANKLGGTIVLLDPGLDECKRRAIERETPNAIRGIDEWYRKAKEPWVPPLIKAATLTIGLDGWPV